MIGTEASDQRASEASRAQIVHFTRADPRYRGLQLPGGIILRYSFTRSLYFYLRTRVEDGRIVTLVFASDSPFELQKSGIGEVSTPMFDRRTHQFDAQADENHLVKLETLLNSWIAFINESDVEERERFTSFHLDPKIANGLHKF